MNIYTSTRAMPYVYMCVHKITGKFYIGYREGNVRLGRVSTDDFPKYKTSSKMVKQNFSEFVWNIVAEFYDGNDAYDFEQQLIYQNWDNPLLLNKFFYNGKRQFRGGTFSEEHKRKISESLKGKKKKPLSEEHKRNLSLLRKGKAGHPHSEETKRKLSDIKTGTKTGKPAWNRGLPQGSETRAKISRSITKLMDLLTSDDRKEKFGHVGSDNGFFNRTHSEFTIDYLSKKQKANRQNNRHTCPHCEKNIDVANYARYHGDRCKLIVQCQTSRLL